jgi:hypothetical protein
MFKLTLALCILAVATAGDCKFTYQAWSKCSKACGSGVQVRNVKVSAYPTNGGAACPTKATRVCNSHKCGDCEFTYKPWTACSKACGSGVQYRNVRVTKYPVAGGAACPGSSTRGCNSHKCGDCKFTYKSWTKCSKACGTGVQYRNVKVDTYPSAGGKACPGPSTRVCNSHKCKKQHCKFTYKSWTPCSKACGNGVQYRPVKVTKYPKYGGDRCPNKATRVCNSFKCGANLAAKFHKKHGGAPCKSTYCTYDGAHTEVFMKTRDDFGNILKEHERWHCEHTTGTKCLCTCAKTLPCRLRHHHKTGYTKDFKMCKPLA